VAAATRSSYIATETTPVKEPEEPAAPPVPHHPAAGSPLSDREREVAELLLLRMPYRDIGRQLFISAKTVEHHVARIRRRLSLGDVVHGLSPEN
jgi:DNA-binding CsgD family transcriptional regulator